MMESTVATSKTALMLAALNHMTHAIVLMVPAAAPVAASIFLGGFFFNRLAGKREPKVLADIIQVTEDYNAMLNRILEDRRNINQMLTEIAQRLTVLDKRLNDSVADVRHETYPVDTRDGESRQLLSDTLDRLMQTYPALDAGQRNHPGYMRRACKDLSEHHILVIESANQYVKEADNALVSYERQLTELSRVIKPGFRAK